ncbi:MAG: hypothetical protein ACOC1K_07760 [Nanoarchaeota archaeon]
MTPTKNLHQKALADLTDDGRKEITVSSSDLNKMIDEYIEAQRKEGVAFVELDGLLIEDMEEFVDFVDGLGDGQRRRFVDVLNSSENAAVTWKSLKKLNLSDDEMKGLFYVTEEINGVRQAPFSARDPFVSEISEYPKDLPFDAQKIINRYNLSKKRIRYNIDELDELFEIYKNNNFGEKFQDIPLFKDGKQIGTRTLERGEIPFVITKDGELKASIRRVVLEENGVYKSGADYWDGMPHPALARGQKVKTAGVLRPIERNGIKYLEIENASGHLWPTPESLKEARKILRQKAQELGFSGIRLKNHQTGENF